MGRYEGAIFDLDGTLIDSDKIAQAAMCELFEALKFLPLDEAELASLPGKSSRILIPALLKKRKITDMETHSVILAAYRNKYDAMWDHEARLMPYAKEVLEELHDRGILLAIATTNRTAVIERFLEKYNLQGWFRCFVSGDMISRFKPDPEVYIRAAEQFCCTRDRILGIEDTQIGCEAVRAAGLACAAISGERLGGHDFPSADYRLSSLRDILVLF